MKYNTLKFISLLLIIVIVVVSISSCKNNSNGNDSTENGSSLSNSTKKSLDERKEIAEEAVAQYINNYMRGCATTGKYSVIDYSQMKLLTKIILKFLKAGIFHIYLSNRNLHNYGLV